MLPPAAQDVNWKATVITFRNETYWAANVSITWCNQDGEMPREAFTLSGVTFTMHYVSCFAPGGGSVRGEATAPGREAWSFFLPSRSLPDPDGNKVDISPDRTLGAGWIGNTLTILVHV